MWIKAPYCKKGHAYGEDGWRPCPGVIHEHWVETMTVMELIHKLSGFDGNRPVFTQPATGIDAGRIMYVKEVFIDEYGEIGIR